MSKCTRQIALWFTYHIPRFGFLNQLGDSQLYNFSSRKSNIFLLPSQIPGMHVLPKHKYNQTCIYIRKKQTKKKHRMN